MKQYWQAAETLYYIYSASMAPYVNKRIINILQIERLNLANVVVRREKMVLIDLQLIAEIT